MWVPVDCRDAAAQPKAVINQRLVPEAKCLLAHTTLAVPTVGK
jgi:hypothetical protein